MRAKVKRNFKHVDITFDNKEKLRLDKMHYIKIEGEKAYVINKFTGIVNLYNEVGFFKCSKEKKEKTLSGKIRIIEGRINKIKNINGLEWF